MSNFENDIKNVFEGAEFAPSERVWAGVEAALKPKKKKGIIFMWQTYGIAAGLALALTFGFLYQNGVFNGTEQIPGKELSSNEENGENKNAVGDKERDKKNTPEKEQLVAPSSEEENLVASNKELNQDSDDSETISSQSLNDTKVLIAAPSGKENIAINKSVIAQQNNREIISDTEALLIESDPVSLEDPMVVSMLGGRPYINSLAAEKLLWNSRLDLISMTKVDVRTMAKLDEGRPTRQKILNGSLGNSSINFTSSDNQSLNTAQLRDPDSNLAVNAFVSNSLDNNPNDVLEEAQGAISAGIGMSFELSDRLSLNVGVRYSEFKFRSVSNAYSVENGLSLPIYIPAGFDSRNVFFAGRYNLNNTIQSAFLQSTVGYKIIKVGKFDVAVQAGVGFDYFLSYKIRGDLNFLSTRKINPGENGSLSKTSISGISGLSVNYRLNERLGLGADFTYRKFFSQGIAQRTPSSVIGFGLSVNYFLNKRED